MEAITETTWHDRKRILGMPITFTKYYINGNKFISSRGLFTTVQNEILLYRIMDFEVIRTLFDKMFNVGTIIVFSADSSDSTFKIEKIKSPIEVKEMLSKLVDEERTKAGIKGSEMFGVAHHAI